MSETNNTISAKFLKRTIYTCLFSMEGSGTKVRLPITSVDADWDKLSGGETFLIPVSMLEKGVVNQPRMQVSNLPSITEGRCKSLGFGEMDKHRYKSEAVLYVADSNISNAYGIPQGTEYYWMSSLYDVPEKEQLLCFNRYQAKSKLGTSSLVVSHISSYEKGNGKRVMLGRIILVDGEPFAKSHMAAAKLSEYAPFHYNDMSIALISKTEANLFSDEAPSTDDERMFFRRNIH